MGHFPCRNINMSDLYPHNNNTGLGFFIQPRTEDTTQAISQTCLAEEILSVYRISTHCRQWRVSKISMSAGRWWSPLWVPALCGTCRSLKMCFIKPVLLSVKQAGVLFWNISMQMSALIWGVLRQNVTLCAVSQCWLRIS